MLDPTMRKRADNLVATGNIAAIALHTNLEKHFPFVGDLPLPDWNFFLTVAFVFVAVTQLEQRSALPPSDIHGMREIVAASFQSWQRDAFDAFEDCKKFYDRNFSMMSGLPQYSKGLDHAFLSADILGTWMVWNVIGRMQEPDVEWRLARTLGTYAAHEFGRWWVHLPFEAITAKL